MRLSWDTELSDKERALYKGGDWTEEPRGLGGKPREWEPKKLRRVSTRLSGGGVGRAEVRVTEETMREKLTQQM